MAITERPNRHIQARDAGLVPDGGGGVLLPDFASRFPILKFLEARYHPEDGLFEARVPLNRLYRGDVAIDPAQVTRLKKLIEEEAAISGSTGQQVPLLLAVLPDIPDLPVLNGFHRTAALFILGREHATARIRPTETWEDVLDQRIKNAGEHKSVEFVRIVGWVKELFARTRWAKKISAFQAFELAAQDAMTGRNFKLTDDEVVDIKAWVEEKHGHWGLAIGSIKSFLRTDDLADPGLVKEVRHRASGRTLDVLTPDHLRTIANALPNKHDFQRLVSDAAKARILTVARTGVLSNAIANAASLNEAREIIESIQFGLTDQLFITHPSATNASNNTPESSPEIIHEKPSEGEQKFENEVQRRVFTDYLRSVEARALKSGLTESYIVRTDFRGFGINVGTSALNEREEQEEKRRKQEQKRASNEPYFYMAAYGELVFAPDRLMVVSPLMPKGTYASLTPTEGRILQILLEDPERVHNLKDAFPDYGDDIEHLIRVNVSRLRAKLGDKVSVRAKIRGNRIIHTVPGVGYTLTENAIAGALLTTKGEDQVIFESNVSPKNN